MKKELENILMGNSAFVVDGVLNKNKLTELANKYDSVLLKILMKNSLIKSHFFTEIEPGLLVFKLETFLQFVNNKEFLPNSFTSYKSRIGLTTPDKKYISDNNDIVLNFPYKDCILEGGQDKEEIKREEIFFNEILAPSEINRLLDYKVFENFVRYSSDGESKVDVLGLDENLVIKGNNLVVLHSLQERFSKKIKCIFIDPPYYFIKNKPSDTFSYNSNFKLSTWLVFMKNRIESAYKLLRDDGVIFAAISDEGAHYLKVLMDDIFDMENFIADVTWESRKSISSDGLLSMNSNHILVYARDKNRINKNDFRLSLDIESFMYDDNDGRGPYRVEPFDAPDVRKNLEYAIKNPNTGDVYLPPTGRHWRTDEQTYLQYLKENRIRFGSKGTSKPQYKAYYEEVKSVGKGKASSTIWHDITPSILWLNLDTNTNATNDQVELFGESVFTNPKPEDLVKRAIELSTDEGDYVLDFFMGSGTTPAVALKLNRKFIGIEQMDYINTVSVERLKKVIEGEQTGISKAVNWKGGGSFVYCELKNDAQNTVEQIKQAESLDELLIIFNKMKSSSFLSYRVNPKKMLEEDFIALSLAEQKQLLLELIDNNNLYVNYSDIEDVHYNISDEDKKLNRLFYGEE
jgi:type III restriction-modification system methylation subunit